MYVRTVKVPSSSGKINEYVRIVEAYREQGKVKQRVVADLGRRDVLQALLPQLQRLLAGEQALVGQEATGPVKVLEAATWGPMLVVQCLARDLGLTAVLHGALDSDRDEPSPRVAPPAERAIAEAAESEEAGPGRDVA